MLGDVLTIGSLTLVTFSCWLCANDPFCRNGCLVWQSLGHWAGSTPPIWRPTVIWYDRRLISHDCQEHLTLPASVNAANLVWKWAGYICGYGNGLEFIYNYPEARWSSSASVVMPKWLHRVDFLLCYLFTNTSYSAYILLFLHHSLLLLSNYLATPSFSLSLFSKYRHIIYST